MSYSIYVISNVPEKFPPIFHSLKPERVNFFDGSNFESFSKLVNTCVHSCPTETIIISSHKVMPKAEHVAKVLYLLEYGFAFVSLCNFRFFAFKKELFRRMGPFDERYVGGGFEDYDFCVRLVEADLASYITTEVPCNHAPSSWGDYSYGMKVWSTKWKHTWQEGNPIPLSLERKWPEEQYNYDWGASTSIKYLSSKTHSYIWPDPHVEPFFKIIKIRQS